MRSDFIKINNNTATQTRNILKNIPVVSNAAYHITISSDSNLSKINEILRSEKFEIEEKENKTYIGSSYTYIGPKSVFSDIAYIINYCIKNYNAKWDIIDDAKNKSIIIKMVMNDDEYLFGIDFEKVNTKEYTTEL